MWATSTDRALVVVVVRTVCMTNKALLASQPMHLIMEPCPCGHDPLGPAPVRRSVRRDVDHLVIGIARRHDTDVDDRIKSCNSNPSRQCEHCLDHEPCQCTTEA